MDFVALLTAFGVGSVVTASIQYLLASRSAAKRRTYDERKEAYLGLAAAWMRQSQEGISNNNMHDVGHWLLRCEFVAPPEMSEVFEHADNFLSLRCEFVAPPEMLSVLKEWADSKPGSPNKLKATDRLKAAMRNDLSNFR